MGLKSCEIFFDNPWNTYYAGQIINGRTEITVDAPKKVRGINICFRGESNTNWFIEESKTNNEGKQENERIDLTGSEEYFKIQYYLLGGQGNEIELPTGKHVYPFTCALPPTLPSSFEGEFGYVRYTVKVTLDRPWKFDQETKTAFTVLSSIDLNLNPRLKEPTRVTLEKYFCCCWCKSGPLTCVISLPCTGFVPGQTVPIVAEVDNISNVEVLNVHFALQKVVTYYSQTPRRETKKDEVLIAELSVGPVAAHGSNTWNQSIVLPPLPPSNLTNCSLIDLDYELEVEVRVSGFFHQNMTSKIPVTIGTIPFAGAIPSAPPPMAAPLDTVVVTLPPQNNNQASDANWSNNNPNQMIINNSPSPAPAAPWSMPPAFGQSPYGTQSIQDKNDNEYTRYNNDARNYKPMYPVFDFGNKPPQ